LPLLVSGEGEGFRRASFPDYLEAVKAIVSLVPPGRVTTYGSIARVLSVSPRLVGALLKANDEPIVVPCHRVVRSNGELGGYSMGGPSVKRRLLELEGVGFDEEGRVRREYIVDIADLIA